jgi:hypothetical protein
MSYPLELCLLLSGSTLVVRTRCPLGAKADICSAANSARFHRLVAANVQDKVTAARTLRATNPINSLERSIRNFDANLTVVADCAGMERHEGVFDHILREGITC